MTCHAEAPKGHKNHPYGLCGSQAEGADDDVVRSPLQLVDCWVCIHMLLDKPLPVEPDVPEHRKLEEAKKTDDATQVVGEFMEWLGSQGIFLAHYDQQYEKGGISKKYIQAKVVRLENADEDVDETLSGDEWHAWHDLDRPERWYDSMQQVGTPWRSLMAKFFEIDEQKLEAEKMALLEHQREINKAAEWARTEGRKKLTRR